MGFFVCTCRWSRKQSLFFFFCLSKNQNCKNGEFKASQWERTHTNTTSTHRIKDNDVNRMIEYRSSQSKFMKRIVLTNFSSFTESKNCVHKFTLPTECSASQDENGFILHQPFLKVFVWIRDYMFMVLFAFHLVFAICTQ